MSPSPFVKEDTINIDVAEECRWRSSAKSYPFILAADADEDKLLPLSSGGVVLYDALPPHITVLFVARCATFLRRLRQS